MRRSRRRFSACEGSGFSAYEGSGDDSGYRSRECESAEPDDASVNRNKAARDVEEGLWGLDEAVPGASARMNWRGTNEKWRGD